jgi:hypothetical protein
VIPCVSPIYRLPCKEIYEWKTGMNVTKKDHLA